MERFSPWFSNLAVANNHTSYCGLVRGLHVEEEQISGLPKCLNYCEIFVAYTQLTDVTACHKIQLGGPRV
jgi:hypothetical protein